MGDGDTWMWLLTHVRVFLELSIPKVSVSELGPQSVLNWV